MLPRKCCCKLEVQSKRVVLQGKHWEACFSTGTLRKGMDEKLAYTIQIKQHLKAMPTDLMGSILSSTLPVTVQ